MAGRLTHQEIEELLAAYALDAVEPDEAAAVRAHLEQCPRCQSELATHREVAASLAHAGSPAPEGLWERISAALEEAPPSLDLSRVAGSAPPPRRSYTRPLAAVGGLAAAVIGVLGFQVIRQDQRIDQLSEAARQRALLQAAASADADARAQRVVLRSEDGRLYAQAALQPNGEGYLVRHNLPPLPEGRTYQLWGRVDDRMVSLGVLGPAPGVVAFHVHGDVDTVAVTDEQAGGMATPTRAPMVRGFLPDR